MDKFEIDADEKIRRKQLADKTRKMVMSQLTADAEDDTSIMADYRDCYLQISFSQMHPLMVFCLAKRMKTPGTSRQKQIANELNLKSILGSHAINDDVGCYSYRATHWLDTEMSSSRFFEILNRCVDEAERGYRQLVG